MFPPKLGVGPGVILIARSGGPSGGAVGVTALDGSDSGLLPAALVACTVNV